MVILGINAYHGDAAAVLLQEGGLAAAVEEERFRRVKHWAGFPSDSIRACLKMAGIAPGEIDAFAVSREPLANFWRKAFFTLRHRPSPQMVSDRARNLRRVGTLAHRIAQTLSLKPEAVRRRFHKVEHHPAHLASSFFACPFEEAAVCAIDGFGDFVSTSFARGLGNRLEVFKKVYFPHSLGMVYLALTQYLGFPRYGDEYKVMGLSAYAQPDHAGKLRELIHLKSDGTFELELSFFRHHSDGVSMTWEEGEPAFGPIYTKKLEELLGPARRPEEPLQPRHEAIAASLQKIFEEAVFHMLNALYKETRIPRLCLAGGCALNSVANGKIREHTPFREVYVQPAAGDNGTALGAALYLQHETLRQPRRFVMDHAYWGQAFGHGDLQEALQLKKNELERGNCRWRSIEEESALCRWTAQRLAEGKVVGWFQGRMEWGPRALGNRSILADPRRTDMRQFLNKKIKLREDFRPFAPSILEEQVTDYFPDAPADPFMVETHPVRPEKRSVIPATTHVDGSGRLQTVHREKNPIYWKLLKAFQGETGVPVLLNTSFNENEPIVRTPQEALDCFLRTGMDILVVGSTVFEKSSNGLG